MRKYLLGMVLSVLVILPISVNAAVSVDNAGISAEKTDSCDGNTGICNATVQIYLEPKTAGETIEMATTETLTGTLVPGSKATITDFVGGGKFVISRVGNDISITVSENTSFSAKTLLGTITYTYPADSKDEECNVTLNLNGIIVETIPEAPATGFSLPVIILGLAAVAGIGIFMITRKNTKLFRV